MDDESRDRVFIFTRTQSIDGFHRLFHHKPSNGGIAVEILNRRDLVVGGLAGTVVDIGVTDNAGGDPTRSVFDKVGDNVELSAAAVVNVQSYGARGDGAKDDRADIQKAIDAAFNLSVNAVVFPPGNYLCNGTVFFDHPTNRQDSLAYTSDDSPNRGFRLTVYAHPNAKLLALDGSRPAVLIGPGAVRVENLIVWADDSAMALAYLPKANNKKFIGFAYTGRGTGHHFINCFVRGFFAGWKSAYDEQDILSSEVTWSQCVGEFNYFDVWIAAGNSYANDFYGCRFGGTVNIFNPTGRDVNCFGGSYGYNGAAGAAVVAYSASDAASNANAPYTSDGDERNILTYGTGATGRYGPLISVTISGFSETAPEEYINNGLFDFVCADLPTYGKTLFYLKSYDASTHVATLQWSSGPMYKDHLADSASATATALNTSLQHEINTAGRLIFARMGIPFFGHAKVWGGHLEPNEMPIMIMYKANQTGTSGLVGSIDGTMLQWNRGTATLTPQVQADAYAARTALPLFYLHAATNSRLKVSNIHFHFTDEGGSAVPFSIDAAGEGAFPKLAIKFEGCLLPDLVIVFATGGTPADVVELTWNRYL